MRINAISTPNFKSQWEAQNPYLYMPPTKKQEDSPSFSFKSHRQEYFGGFLAVLAAGFALSKFMARNTTPKSVVEIADRTLGLNKIRGTRRTITQLKEKIFYPMMSVANGETRVLKEDFKTGLIIGGKNRDKLEEFVGAFMEHARELRIHCVELKYPKKSNRVKVVHKALDNAIQHHNATGECVIVNIGDLAAVSKHNVAKTNYASNLEERLAFTPKGVLWTSYTTEADNLPYFYNNLPTLSVKI